jgi:RND family efflux transporter MFP subunit
VESGSHRISITGMGTVTAARRVNVFAEVGGRVTAVYDGLVEGAHIDKGTPLVRVDARDYKYAVDTARASLAQARAGLEEERKRNEVAKRDWEMLQRKRDRPLSGTRAPAPLHQGKPNAGKEEFVEGDMVKRIPQLRSAEAQLQSVRSNLKAAQLQVGRTKIIAPFDAVVVRKDVEIGELVGTATPLATLVGTAAFHVKVAVSIDALASIRVPGTNTADPVGAEAKIIQTVGNETIERSGHVVRVLSELQEEGRMAQLIVAVNDPFQRSTPPEERRIPLLLGSFVRVELEGAQLHNVVELPRAAVREGDTVWLVDAQDQLEIREVEVRWRTRESVLVGGGLKPGERVITSRLAVPLPNMPLRVVDVGGQD